MTLMQDVRATIPGLREAMPDLREVATGLREVVPDARAAMPSIREGIADLRAELPGPWHKERPSLIRRAAVVVVAAFAVTVVAWGVMALVERRRLEAARARAMEEERQALLRAEGEGMGTAIGAPAMGLGTSPGGTSPSETKTLPNAARSSTGSPMSGVTSGVGSNGIPPKVAAHAGGIDGGTSDGR